MRFRPDCSRDGNVFRDIKAPLAQLIFRNESLALPDPRRQFDLGDAGILARLDQRREQDLVEFGAG